MRRVILAGFVALPLTFFQSHPSHAVIVECANCSTLLDQVKSYALQAEQKLMQLQQLQYQLESYKLQIQNAISLPQSMWTNVTGDIMQVRSLANAGSMLTGNSGSILTRLQNAGYYANSVSMMPQNIGAQFQMYQSTMGNAGNSLARTLGLQQGQEQNDAMLQRAIQAQSQSAAGQMQVLQAGVEMAGVTNYNLQQVQTTLTAFAQEQATRDIISADRLAIEDATTQRLTQTQPVALNGYKGY